jgi:hypothetical protein
MKEVRWVRHVAWTGREYVHKGLWWGKPEGRRSLGRSRNRGEDNIKFDLEEIR